MSDYYIVHAPTVAEVAKIMESLLNKGVPAMKILVVSKETWDSLVGNK